MIYGTLSIKNVFVYNKGCTPSVFVLVSESYLKDGPVFTKDSVQLLSCDGEGQISNIQNTIDLWG